MAEMRFSSSGVPVTTRPPCPMNALRANTSADTPVSCSPASVMGLPLQGAYFCLSGTNPARARWDVSIP